MKKIITLLLTLSMAIGLISTTAMGAHPIGNISSTLSVSGITVTGSSSATARNYLNINFRCGYVNGTYSNSVGSISSNKTIKIC